MRAPVHSVWGRLRTLLHTAVGSHVASWWLNDPWAQGPQKGAGQAFDKGVHSKHGRLELGTRDFKGENTVWHIMQRSELKNTAGEPLSTAVCQGWAAALEAGSPRPSTVSPGERSPETGLRFEGPQLSGSLPPLQPHHHLPSAADPVA